MNLKETAYPLVSVVVPAYNAAGGDDDDYIVCLLIN